MRGSETVTLTVNRKSDLGKVTRLNRFLLDYILGHVAFSLPMRVQCSLDA